MKKIIATGRWMEEYETCSCSYVAKFKKCLPGYCSNHGTNRKYVYKLVEPTIIGWAHC